MPHSPDIKQNLDDCISDFQISGQSFINENCHNRRTSHDIGMKLGAVIKLGKTNTITSKKFTTTSCRKIVTSLSFFQFMANLQPSGSRIPDVWFMKLKSSLTITFYLTKLDNRTIKSLTQVFYYIALSKDTIFAKKM